jgi:hypothetical protein
MQTGTHANHAINKAEIFMSFKFGAFYLAFEYCPVENYLFAIIVVVGVCPVPVSVFSRSLILSSSLGIFFDSTSTS